MKILEYQKEKPEFQNSLIYKGSMEKATKIARHYGFYLIEPLTINKRLPMSLSQAKKDSLKERDFSDFPRDYMSTLKKYIDEEMHRFSQPVMICHIVERSSDWAELRLEIIGTKKSMAEAAVIKTALVILDDLGYKDLFVKLNCIGDKESSSNFLKELTNYYRGYINDFSPTLQEQLKKDILKVYINHSEKYKAINENAPRPISFLSEESQKHFKEIIEFLENIKIDYEINEELISCSACLPKTLYEIVSFQDNSNEEILAHGERHNYLAQNIGLNKKVPIVGIGINLKREDRKKDLYLQDNVLNKPKICLIHLGFEAKKKSLDILDIFRRSGILIHQSLCSDSFAIQLKKAEKLNVPYTIIIGQKEALENSVIFRDMETRYQENIGINELGAFLIKLRSKKSI